MFLRGATGGMDGWVMEVREGINRKKSMAPIMIYLSYINEAAEPAMFAPCSIAQLKNLEHAKMINSGNNNDGDT